MNKQGISATTKGCCTACDKPIVGQVTRLSTIDEMICQTDF